jgi:hypothetical protein
VPDEDNARPVMNVSVVGDIDQELGKSAILNPAVEDGDDWVEVDRILQQELDVNVLQLDGGFFFHYGSQDCVLALWLSL